MTFEEWWQANMVPCHNSHLKVTCEETWLASRKAALEDAAKVCQSHEPKDFTTAGIITRAKCAEAILALK